MNAPTEDQISAAVALIKQHFRDYGNGAADTRMSALVYAIHVVLSGDGAPAAEYAQTLEDARQAEKAEAAEIDLDDDDDADGNVINGEDLVNEALVEPTPEPVPDEAPAAEHAPEPVADEDDEDFYSDEELGAMTVEQLTAIATEGGLTVDPAFDKAAIIDLIKSAP